MRTAGGDLLRPRNQVGELGLTAVLGPRRSSASITAQSASARECRRLGSSSRQLVDDGDDVVNLSLAAFWGDIALDQFHDGDDEAAHLEDRTRARDVET